MALRSTLPRLFKRCGVAAALLLATTLAAAPFRVTTWNLQPNVVLGTNGASREFQQHLIQEAADALRRLNPDVILLQHVMDWESCGQLVKELQPESYTVVVCSSFQNVRDKARPLPQVAVLSKVKAYISWAQSWKNSAQTPAAPGGFAFAAFRIGEKNIGFISAGMSDSAFGVEDNYSAASQRAREESARQLVQQIADLQNWTANRPSAFVVAGDFDTTRDDIRLAGEKTLGQLEKFGCEDSMTGLPLEKRITFSGNSRRAGATLDYIFTRDAGFVAKPLITQGALSGHNAATCVMDFDAPRLPLSPPTQMAGVAVPEKVAADTPAFTRNTTLYWALAGFLAGMLAIFILSQWFGRRSANRAMAAALLELKAKTGPSVSIANAERILLTRSPDTASYSQVMASPGPASDAIRAGVIAQLTGWFKTRFVQRLIAERAELVATQEIAALKVLAVDERLEKVERQIQQRNQEYEQRIDELLKELVVAKEENRELIRAKIALLKVEMEKARLRNNARDEKQRQN